MSNFQYQLSVDVRDQLTVSQASCNHQPMVETQEIRDAFAARLNQALDGKNGVRKGRGRNVDFYEAMRAHPSFSASTQATHKWLRAESMPGRANMLAIAEWLGVRVEWLQYGEGEPHQMTTQPKPTSPEKVEAQPPARRAAVVAALATPRSQEALERIAKAANEGRLTEADLILLEQIASRFESSAGTETGQDQPANGNQRLKERLRKNDPGTQR